MIGLGEAYLMIIAFRMPSKLAFPADDGIRQIWRVSAPETACSAAILLNLQPHVQSQAPTWFSFPEACMCRKPIRSQKYLLRALL